MISNVVQAPRVLFSSAAMLKLVSMAERAARQPATVLLIGETGSGKEVMSRLIHEKSLRASKPFVDLNCAALPEHLVESELFGYEKGAFSGADSSKPGLFEVADGGTVFLDEIGDLDPRIQVKLLRVLDGAPYYRLGGTRKVTVNVRVIAATNRDLERDVATGRFRRDLYHRLAEFVLRIPPLRDRKGEIIPLAEQFLQDGGFTHSISAEAKQALMAYDWPGNVRQLRNVILRAAIHADSESEIQFEHLELDPFLSGNESEVEEEAHAAEPAPADYRLEAMERRSIEAALEKAGGNRDKAAEQLGISRRTLFRRLKTYGLMKKTSAASHAEHAEPLGELGDAQKFSFRAELNGAAVILQGEKRFDVKTANLSLKGIAIDGLKEPIFTKAPVDVEFNLPDITETLRLRAYLRWMNSDGRAGLEFADMNDPVRMMVKTWVERKMKEEGWAALPSGSFSA